MKRWRIIENEWNLKAAPWRDAVGIEETDEDMAVPAIVCWFTRGWGEYLAQSVVDQHNAQPGDGQGHDL